MFATGLSLLALLVDFFVSSFFDVVFFFKGVLGCEKADEVLGDCNQSEEMMEESSDMSKVGVAGGLDGVLPPFNDPLGCLDDDDDEEELDDFFGDFVAGEFDFRSAEMIGLSRRSKKLIVKSEVQRELNE